MRVHFVKQVLSAAVLAAVALAAAAATEPLDKIVAVVNEAPISRLDVAREAQRMQREQETLSVNRAEQLALNYLINHQLQLQRARLLEINIPAALLEQRIADLLREMNLSGSEGLARAAKTRFLMSADELRQRLYEDLQIQALFYREVFAETDAYEDEVEQFLIHEADGVAQVREYRLRHILLTLAADSASAAEKREQIQALRARALAGEDFARLAQTLSDGDNAAAGGDLGFRAEADLPDRFLAVVQNMSPGEISEPLRTGRGFHLLKLEAARGGELREAIRRFHLSHIFFPLEAEEQARTVRGTISTAEDFRRAVQTYSDDRISAEKEGVIGWFDETSLPGYFADNVRQMQVGDISAPVISPYGWHILYLDDAEQEEFNIQGLRDQARRLLRERRALAQRDIWLRRLRNNAYVRIVDPAFTAAAADR